MEPLPSWTQTGAVLGLEGGTETVLRDLEKLNPMTTDGVTGGGLPVSALWLQDWSGERDFKIADEEQRVGLWWNWEVRWWAISPRASWLTKSLCPRLYLGKHDKWRQRYFK